MKINLPPTKKARIEMLPLMDIVFLLLVVFIYSMLSMSIHRGLPVDLPTSSVVEVEKETLLSVTVNENGQVFVDNENIKIEDLTQYLISKSQHLKNPGILLFAHKDISYQNLFKILDRIKTAGLEKISLQAELESVGSSQIKP